MSVSVNYGVQYRNQFLLEWETTPDEDVKVYFGGTSATGPFKEIGTVPAGRTYFIDVVDDLAESTTYYWRILGQDSASAADLSIQSEPVVYTYGTIDYLATTPRYTTVALVKARLGIADTQTAYDDRVTQAIVASELQMDVYMQRSFPDVGDNPQIPGVPQAIVEAATSIATSVYKQGDMPLGVGNDDAWIGAISITDAVRAEFNRNPMLMGFKLAWGVA